MDRLEQLKEAQQRIDALTAAGTDIPSREARRAMNRLITLLRGATPEELKAFDQWKAAVEREGRTA